MFQFWASIVVQIFSYIYCIKFYQQLFLPKTSFKYPLSNFALNVTHRLPRNTAINISDHHIQIQTVKMRINKALHKSDHHSKIKCCLYGQKLACNPARCIYLLETVYMRKHLFPKSENRAKLSSNLTWVVSWQLVPWVNLHWSCWS